MSIVAPPGAEGGQRLLLSVPLPPQVMHVTLPPLATPGKLVEFQLRAPLVDVPDGPLDALALAAGESRGILLERSSSGGLKRKAPTMGNGGMFIGGAADGSAITSPPSRKRAPRGLSSAEAAIFGAHDEALAAVPLLRGEPGSRASPGSLTPRISHPAVGIQVRRFDMDAASRRNTPDTSELSRLRTMPELLHTWLACRALCPRLPLPAFSLAELEQTLCLGPDIAAPPAAAALAATAEDAAAPYPTDLDAAAPTAATPDATAPNDSRPPAEGLLKRLHRALLTGVVAAAAQPETIDRETRAWLSEGENWEVALFAALQTGVWAKRHTAGTFPMWRPEGRRVGGKFGQWVTETGPALCGTFGCVLPNNHSGLHKLPESTADRPRTARARRAEVALPTEEGADGSAEARAAAAEARAAAEPGAVAAAAAAGDQCAPAEPAEPEAPQAGLAAAAAALASTALAAAALAAQGGGAPGPPASMVPCAELGAPDRLLVLHCLCSALLTADERKEATSALEAMHLGGDSDGGEYWLVQNDSRLYRAYLAGSGGDGSLPLSSALQLLSVDRGELLHFAQLLRRCATAADRGADTHTSSAAPAAAAARVLLGRLMQRLGEEELATLADLPPPATPSPPENAKRLLESHKPRRKHPASPNGSVLGTVLGMGHGSSGGGGGGSGGFDEEMGETPHVRAALRVGKVPIGHRQLAWRAVLKLSIPRKVRNRQTFFGDDDFARAARIAAGGRVHGEKHPDGGSAALADSVDSVAGRESDPGKQPLFQVEAILGRRLAQGGEPQYLVRWAGYTPEDDSWESWVQLGACIAVVTQYHAAEFAKAVSPKQEFAFGCPAADACKTDADLPGWRILAKRTGSGREYRTYFGPLGEHVRSRSLAIQLAGLYELPSHWRPHSSPA